jgi:hypothetical protein
MGCDQSIPVDRSNNPVYRSNKISTGGGFSDDGTPLHPVLTGGMDTGGGVYESGGGCDTGTGGCSGGDSGGGGCGGDSGGGGTTSDS